LAEAIDLKDNELRGIIQACNQLEDEVERWVLSVGAVPLGKPFGLILDT
jgi:hypothetical protein